jgi:NCAIR mutase (PurE)-related protein
MDDQQLHSLVDGIRSGAIEPDAAVASLRRLPYADVGDALVDHHRALRQGMPEAVYGPGKTVEHCVKIVGELIEHGSGPVLLTRADAAQRTACLEAFGSAEEGSGALLWRRPEPHRSSSVLVITAGTSDLPVAAEAQLTLRAHGFEPSMIVDVGVSGLHRLLARIDDVTAVDAIVVVAGMEGALASVIGGLTSVPVVAVPTSVGYGAGLDGVTALLSMHASCASGITVVGIDNGFGAACAIARACR